MIWEPLRITQARPGPSAGTTAGDCGIPLSPNTTSDSLGADGGFLDGAQASVERFKAKGGRDENNALDKIHQQRLTANVCVLAATKDTTRGDEMKSNKWRNQRTRQRISGSVPARLGSAFDKAGVGLPERKVMKDGLENERQSKVLLKV